MNAAQHLRVTVEMLSDWHVGAGEGRPGDVDALTRRDDDGLPCIPGRTLAGMLRDACEQATAALGEEWWPVLHRVFGEDPAVQRDDAGRAAQPATINVDDARVSPALREALRAPQRSALRDSMTVVRPGVAIDPATGRARDDHLRLIEMATAGLRLHASVSLGDDRDGLALLWAGSQLLRAIGGGRRRGAGRCSLTLHNANGEELDRGEMLRRLEGHPELPAKGAVAPTNGPDARPPGDATSWSRIQLTLRADAPLVIPRVVTGNVVRTRDAIPGTLLLGPVARALDEAAGPGTASALIAASHLLVTDHTPAVNGQPGLAVPHALDRPKDGEGGVANRLEGDAGGDGIARKPMRRGYVADVADGVVLVEPTIVARTHNTVTDVSQRPEGEGGVYTYEAIAAQTEFAGEVRIAAGILDTDTLNEFRRCLSNRRLRIGRGKHSEYGAATITEATLLQTDADTDERIDTTCASARLWLTSSLLVDDDALRPMSGSPAIAAALTRALGDGTDVTVDVIVGRTERRDSWSAAWGLPRPTLTGPCAGTCAIVSFTPPIMRSRLAALELSGLGQRRAEGYGQMRLDPEILDPSVTLTFSDVRAEVPEPAALIAPGSTAHDTARAIERAAWRTAIARAAQVAAADEGLRRKLGAPRGASRSQMGRLRSLARDVHVRSIADPTGPSTQPILDWIAHDRVKNGDARYDGLRTLAADPDKVWSYLKVDETVLTDDGQGALRAELRNEALVTLIDQLARGIAAQSAVHDGSEGPNGA